jgi:tRNA C32,U32 (ribose-2'-O)-methylase TrmJ
MGSGECRATTLSSRDCRNAGRSPWDEARARSEITAEEQHEFAVIFGKDGEMAAERLS